jgi:tungstate transport system ATP-binding protein
MNNPANEFVARFVGMESILEGRVLETREGIVVISAFDRQMCAIGQARAGEEVLCCIRPENVAVDASSDSRLNGGAVNVYRGKITHVYSMGPFLKVSLDCGLPLLSLVTREAFGDLKLAEGKEVYASFRPASVHLIRGNASDD